MKNLSYAALVAAFSFGLLSIPCASRGAPEGTAATAQAREADAAPREREPERALRLKPRQARTKSTRGEKGTKPPREGRAEKQAAKEEGKRGIAAEEAKVARAEESANAGRFGEARDILKDVNRDALSQAKADAAAYLDARLTVDGTKQVDAFAAYLKDYPKGRHRRDATLDLARLHYVQGDYAESDRLLAIFSPGVEKDHTGREGLVLRGLAQLAGGDAAGALQFLTSCARDLRGTAEEEAYYFATSQAALRSGKPQAAVDALRILLERHAQGAYAPQALYAMGMALEQMGRAADGTTVFRQVAQRFPDSYEAARVRDRGIRPGQTIATGLPIGGGYAIQVGAFSRRDLADALARDLRMSGVADVSVKQGNESPSLYRVRAGAFATREEARAFGERLRRDRGFSFTVVPH